jgi:hypothetical protein
LKADIDRLADEGVVVRSEASNADQLLDDLTSTERRQVVIADVQLVPDEVDYKRLNPRQVLLLNGTRAIRQFAEDRFDLPEGFRRITVEVYKQLQERHFGFPQALDAACQVLGNQYALAVRRPNGEKVFIYLRGMIEGHELYRETALYRQGLIDTSVPELVRHGKVDWKEFKYLGKNEFRVPRRAPRRGRMHNLVKTQYLPDLERPRDMWLEWFNTSYDDNCDFALGQGNKEQRTGPKMTRSDEYFDAHGRWVLELLADNLGDRAHLAGSMLYPTPFAIALYDSIRYRLHNKKGNNWQTAERLLLAAARRCANGWEDGNGRQYQMFQSTPPQINEVLKPLYSGIVVRR